MITWNVLIQKTPLSQSVLVLLPVPTLWSKYQSKYHYNITENHGRLWLKLFMKRMDFYTLSNNNDHIHNMAIKT